MGELSGDGALAGIREWGSPDLRAHIRHLIDCNEPGVEDIILGTLAEAGPVRPLLCRVLAERDPDRDPDYALQHFYAETDGPVRRWRPGGLPQPVGLAVRDHQTAQGQAGRAHHAGRDALVRHPSPDRGDGPG